jgi:hypothetical protein
MDSNYSTFLGSKNSVVRVWAGGTSTTPYFLAAYFALRNTNLGGGKRGRGGKRSAAKSRTETKLLVRQKGGNAPKESVEDGPYGVKIPAPPSLT